MSGPDVCGNSWHAPRNGFDVVPTPWIGRESRDDDNMKHQPSRSNPAAQPASHSPAAPRENALTKTIRLLHKLNVFLVSQEEGENLPFDLTLKGDGSGWINDTENWNRIFTFDNVEGLVAYLEADTRTRIHMSRRGAQ